MKTYKPQLTAADAAIAKGMLARGDYQSDIAAFFRTNPGRISEINTGRRFADVKASALTELPPRDPDDKRWN